MDVLCFRPIGRTWHRNRVLIHPLASKNAGCGYDYIIVFRRARVDGTSEYSLLPAPGEGGDTSICTKWIDAFSILTDSDFVLALQCRTC